ncbi:MAG: lipopolysaccharide biosynthesis protein [Phycisphaerales bacterium]
MRHSTRLFLNTCYTLTRMALTVALGLATTRLAMKALGQTEFGIIGVLGAAGALLAVVTEALNQSVMRHLAVEIGRGAAGKLAAVFSTSVFTFLGIAAAVGVVGVAVSPWLVGWVDIPEGRDWAARWVFLATLARVVVAVAATPFRAWALARQEMLLLAVADVLNSALMLAAALMIDHAPMDKLVFYAAAVAAAGVVVELSVILLVVGRRAEARPAWSQCRRAELKELLDFGVWTFLGNVGWQLRNQGSQIILNKFYGLQVNAAYTVALQGANYQNSIASSVLNATSPMLMRAGGAGHGDMVHRLTIIQGKYAAIAALAFVVPSVLECEQLLPLWLKEVPPAALVLTPLMIAAMWLQVLANSLLAPIMATGDVGPMFRANTAYEIVFLTGAVGVMLVALPGVWFLPVVVIAIILAQMLSRAGYVARQTGLSRREWAARTLRPVMVTAGAAFAAAGCARLAMPETLWRIGAVVAATGLALAPAAWFLALEPWERHQFRRIFGAAAGRIGLKSVVIPTGQDAL